MIADGGIGDVRGMQAVRYETLPVAGERRVPWQIDPTLSNGGLFFDGVCHLFDFLDSVFGPVKEVHGVVANRAGAYETEDTGSASFRFETGVIASGFWCYASDAKLDRPTVLRAMARPQSSPAYPQPAPT